ncbi:MAG TPA: 16S rRNA (guanine(966)-N(2))-methyltransferase RsmD [Candidatus Enterocloster faecavium]|uniref:16S rRNA (Guanine(966)-N(2))-methyltransferase RsmD n=1 Tax=Candidatus Enterocloster faecavium TaxID=2838560 RepID=A0A9D2RKQ2_9FIRM|nr:16S rRNA (guanine(966)-N(2))-methyltransferase RsmD [Candidatus Enterocloster faecavium]
MRVIAGSARRLLLKTPEGMDTRPTTDRIKETLFNMLQPQIPGCHFLDLFSGSGAIAIEALSRGAAEAVLIENQAQAVSCIRQNLSSTHLEERAAVMEGDVFTCLKKLDGHHEPFDIIFMDPPYNHGLERQVLCQLRSSSLLTPHTRIIIEASKDTDFSWLDQEGYELVRDKEYKTNRHVFAARKEE